MKLKKLAALALSGVICLTALVGCGASSDDTIATLGNQKVPYGVANFMAKYQKATVDDIYVMYFGETAWETDLYGYGTTLEDDFKASVMDMLHEVYTLKAHMDEYGVEITDEEKAQISEAATAFLAANSEEAIEEFGATQEIVEEMLELYLIQAKMYDAIAETADHEVSDEEANMRGYTMIEIDLTGYYDDSYSFVEYTEEQLANIKTVALQMDLDLNAIDLETVAEDNGVVPTTGAYSANDTTLDAAVIEVLDSLAVGEVSDMIETEDYIYFVRLDSETDIDATEENRETIIAERELAKYEEVLTAWQEDDGWTVNDAVLDKIDFHNFFTYESDSTETEEIGTEE